VDAYVVYLSLAASCLISLYISRIEQYQKAEKVRLLAVEMQPTAEAKRSHDTEDGLNAFIDEAEEILGLARNAHNGEDSGVDGIVADYHDRLILFLMKHMGSYFARRLHSHQGLRSFSSKAYPAYLSTESIRTCRHLETDILRLTSFLSLIDRPLPKDVTEDEAEEAFAA
jgi:hypothetical protein